MKLAIKTCTLDMPYEQMLDFCVEQKIAAIEIGTGNWSGAPHCDLDLLVSDKTAREKWYDAMRKKGLELCALNCSGNPLAYEKDMDVTKKTFELAHQLGVKKIVMMSGLPVGCEGDKTPVWITTSWPPETQDILDYQWNQVAIPAWLLSWRRIAESSESRSKTTVCSWFTPRKRCSVCVRLSVR